MHVVKGKWTNHEKEQVAADWRARGYSCDTWVDPPGRCWEDFVHEVDELVCPLEGPIEVAWEGETALLEPGDEWYIPRGTRHSVRNKSNATVRWLYGYNASPS